jgi:hypothetical protein
VSRLPDENRAMYDAIWGKARFGGNSHDRRKVRRALMRRVVAAGKVTEHMIEHFFDESPVQRKIREQYAEGSAR